MRKVLLMSAAAFVLLAASPAFAEHHNHKDAGSSGAAAAASGSGGTHHGDRTGGASTHTFSGATGAMPGTGHNGRGDTGGSNRFGAAATGGTRSTGGTHHGDRGATHTFGGTTFGGAAGVTGSTGTTHHGRNNASVNVYGPGGNRNAVQGFHNHNRSFDSIRRVYNAPQRFHYGSYHRPNGWYWHRWSFGEFLPSIFFGRNYWINDWDNFGLYDPPPGTVWVRYGDDAVLIDEYTGEVIRVVYGIFY